MTAASMKILQAAAGIRSPKHFQLLYGRFQRSIQGLSATEQEQVKIEFRRVAKAAWDARQE